MAITRVRAEEIWECYGLRMINTPAFDETARKVSGVKSTRNNIAFWQRYYACMVAMIRQHMLLELAHNELKWLGHKLQSYYRELTPKDPVDNLFDDIENFNQPTGEENMNPIEPKRAFNDDQPFEVRKLAFGQNIERMNAEELISLVRKFEREIESLKAIKTVSKHIAKRIESLEQGLVEVVQQLDSIE